MLNSGFKVKAITPVLLVLLGCMNSFCQESNDNKLKEYRRHREVMAAKERVIFNNDGNDAYQVFPAAWKITTENLLKLRTTPLKQTGVTTISYCTISSSFGQFTHNTKTGEILKALSPFARKQKTKNIVLDLLQKNTDPLKIMVEFSRKNGYEIFWSMRMNDTHDVVHRAAKPYYRWSKLKQEHPEYMMGSMQAPLPNGRWSAMDFSRPEIRQLVVQYIKEVCNNYDIDGIELDFFRHLLLFKKVAQGSVADKTELDMLTDMMEQIRSVTEQAGLKRGRPILLSIRVPDSPEYCKAVGIDLSEWCRKKLVDIIIGSGYFRLNPWQEWVKFGKKHKVKVIAGLSEPRVKNEAPEFKRMSPETYQARALTAWQAGVNGLYIFNEYYPDRAKYLKVIGNRKKLELSDKLYFVSYLDGNPEEYLNGGSRFINKDFLFPTSPSKLTFDTAKSLSINIGDDFTSSEIAGLKPICLGHLRISNLKNDCDISIAVNGHTISEKKYQTPWLHFAINTKFLQPGKNTFTFKLDRKPKSDNNWLMDYQCIKKLTYPEQLPWRRLFKCSNYSEKIFNNSLYLADWGRGAKDYYCLTYPWSVAPNGKTILETELKVEQADDQLAVCLRLSNGQSVEFVSFQKDRVNLRFAGMHHKLNTTDRFHKYKIVTQGDDIKLFIDGKLTLDGTGKFTQYALAGNASIKIPSGNAAQWNKCSIMMGSLSGPGCGAAYWKYIRYTSPVKLLKDFAVSINYVNKAEKVNIWDFADQSVIKCRNLLPYSASRIAPALITMKLDNCYSPSSGLLPSASVPRWKNSRYTSTSAKILQDKTLQQNLLRLDNRGKGKSEFACFTLKIPEKQVDFAGVIIQFQLKMPTNSINADFAVSASKKIAENKYINASFRFNQQWLYSHSGPGILKKIDIGPGWHTYRIIINFKNNLAEVYMDKNVAPVFLTRCYMRTTGTSEIKFGDGSRAVNGVAELSGLEWSWFSN